MYNRILAPLDGSEFSECSLDHVQELAAGCRVAEIVLLMVVESVKTPTWWPEDQGRTSAMSAELDKKEAQVRDKARGYLAGVAERLKQAGTEVKTEVMEKIESQRVAAIIMEYAQKHNVDLIIMSTHGRSGISRWSFGSVADRVVRHSTVPVLTVAPKGCRIPQSPAPAVNS